MTTAAREAFGNSLPSTKSADVLHCNLIFQGVIYTSKMLAPIYNEKGLMEFNIYLLFCKFTFLRIT